MSFRQFGGIQYAPKHNIVSSNYNTSNNLQVTQNVGQPNSYINFQSDISGNIKIFGNVDISGNLIVRENADIAGDLGVNGLTQMNGNVGIGKKPSNYTLDVSGNVNISNDSYINGLIIGKGGGNISNNTALGSNSLHSNTIGKENTAIGYYALYNNTTTDGNTALGSSSLYINSIGYNNTAIGRGALYSNNGNDNTSLGYNALYYNTTGSENVAIGRSTMQNNVTGGYNVAIGGYNCLINNISGSFNISIGAYSLNQNNSGNSNIAIGSYSLNLCDQSYNIAIGSGSLQYGTMITYNTAVGYHSAQYDISGNYNTYLGATTGQPSSDNNIYTYSTAIGANAIISDSNQITLGGKNASNIYPYVTIPGGYLGIGKKPSYNLDVNGNINLSGSLYQNGSPFSGSTQWSTSGSNIYYTTGNVGIGTTTPSTKLDVAGNVNITTNYGLSSNPSLTITDSISSNIIKFLPNSINSSYNPITIDGDQVIVASGTPNSEVLTLTSQVSSGGINSGLRITSNSVTLGAGGTTSTPTLYFQSIGNDKNYIKGNTYLTGEFTTTSSAYLCTNGGNFFIGSGSGNTQICSYGNIEASQYYERYGLVIQTNNYNNVNSPGNYITISPTDYNYGYIQSWSNVDGSYNSSKTSNPLRPLLLNPDGGTIGICKTNTSSSYALDVSGNINFTGSLYQNGSLFSGSTQWSTSGSNIYYITGNVGIGTTTPSVKLDVDGSVNVTNQVTASSFQSSSDYRLKSNIKSIDQSYTIDHLKPVEYDINNKHDMGFLAHEVQEYYPFLVNGEKDGEQMQSLNYIGLISLLVKEVQTLKEEIKKLRK